MDDTEPEERVYPLTPDKLSKTPSWITLGFVFGAAFVWMLPREEKPAPTPVLAARPPPGTGPGSAATPPKRLLTTVEAVFEMYGGNAQWDGDTMEIAFDSGSGEFSEFYEVRRFNAGLYFRSIPKLTRRVLSHGVPAPNSPLRFTETEAQYQRYLLDRREHPIEPELSTSPQLARPTTPPPPAPAPGGRPP